MSISNPPQAAPAAPQANPLRFVPDQNTLSMLFPDPSQQQAFVQLLGAFNNHTLTVTNRLFEAQDQMYSQRLTPLEQSYQQQEVDQFYKELGTKHPELAEHMDAVRQLQINPQLGENPTRADVIEAYAAAARGHLGKYVPTLQASATSTSTPVANTPGAPPQTPPQPSATPTTRPSTPPAPSTPTTAGTSQTLNADSMAALLGKA